MAILRIVRAVFRQSRQRRSVVFERAAKFNTRVQKEAESVNDFITDVYRLAEHCEFSELHNEMVRDRIVVGIK